MNQQYSVESDLFYDADFLNELLGNAAVSMAVLDDSLHIRYVNASFCKLLGYSVEECIGERLLNFIYPDEHQAAIEQQKALREKNTPIYSTERRYVARDGNVVCTLASVSMLQADANKPAVTIVQLISIDKQKETELALAESEKRWNFALEGAGQGVWDLDVINQRVFLSPTWRRMRGMDPSRASLEDADDWFAFVHEDDKARILDASAIKSGSYNKELSYEYRERHRDGHWIWILTRGRATDWLDDGTPTRIIGVDTDITSIKLAQERFAAMSRRLELALSTSQVGVWEMDMASRQVIWDKRMQEIYGISVENGEMNPNDWPEMIVPADRSRVMRSLQVAMKTGAPVTAEFSIRLPSGEIRTVRTRTKRHKSVEGREMLIGINSDITSFVEQAEALRQAKEIADQRNAELEAARLEMEHNSLHDALTGLPNRRYLDETILSMQAEAETSGARALLHIDLDRFKQINDTLGHAAGDAMLVHVAGILAKRAGSNGFVARVGGDEFVMLLSGESARSSNVAVLADSMVHELAAPVPYGKHTCRFGVSIGIAASDRGDTDPGHMLVNADIALYRAKSRGRNRYEFFTAALHRQTVANKRVADEILSGLEDGQFVPYFQPQFCAKDFSIIGAEALARWNHPVLGVLSPDRFMPIAEELNVVARIDEAMFEQSIKALEHWDAIGVDVPRVSVNISSGRLHDEAFCTTLEEMDFDPSRFAFELVESIFLDERDDAVNWNIDRIRDMGIGIDIDDFGTGHASIIGLLHISPHRLKIDRRLVQPIVRSERQRKLLRSIVDIGKSLGIEVLAEGVETIEHAELLTEMGCDALQGYLFARPMRADALEDFVSREEWRHIA